MTNKNEEKNIYLAGAAIALGLFSCYESNVAKKKATANEEILDKFGPRGADESGSSDKYKAGKTGQADKGGSLSVRFSKDGTQPNLSTAKYTTAIGYEAAGKNITGQKNTHVGAYSGYEATAGEKYRYGL